MMGRPLKNMVAFPCDIDSDAPVLRGNSKLFATLTGLKPEYMVNRARDGGRITISGVPYFLEYELKVCNDSALVIEGTKHQLDRLKYLADLQGISVSEMIFNNFGIVEY